MIDEDRCNRGKAAGGAGGKAAKNGKQPRHEGVRPGKGDGESRDRGSGSQLGSNSAATGQHEAVGRESGRRADVASGCGDNTNEGSGGGQVPGADSGGQYRRGNKLPGEPEAPGRGHEGAMAEEERGRTSEAGAAVDR